jgi:hypothetical protein
MMVFISYIIYRPKKVLQFAKWPYEPLIESREQNVKYFLGSKKLENKYYYGGILLWKETQNY